ncbi:MAG: HNH endonuclease [Afipia sp.]
MKLDEYLKLRNNGVMALTVAEGKTMGIDPTKKGWMQFVKTAEVPQALVDAVLNGATTKELRKLAREINCTAGVEMLSCPHTPPKSGSLPKLKKIFGRHLVAATKYLQERGRLLELGNKCATFPVVAREMYALYQNSPGFVEKYGQGQDGLRRLVIEFFDDATPLENNVHDKPARPPKAERRKLAKEAAKQRKPNTQVASEVKAHRHRQDGRIRNNRLPVGALTVEGVDVCSKEFLGTYSWTRLRIKALNLYGAKCMCCGATPEHGDKMNVDHIKPRIRHPELALDIRNTQVICSTCNKGKCNELETDYRSPEQIDAAKSASLVI